MESRMGISRASWDKTVLYGKRIITLLGIAFAFCVALGSLMDGRLWYGIIWRGNLPNAGDLWSVVVEIVQLHPYFSIGVGLSSSIIIGLAFISTGPLFRLVDRFWARLTLGSFFCISVTAFVLLAVERIPYKKSELASAPPPIKHRESLNDLEPCGLAKIFPITENDKSGYIDSKGRVVVSPQFEAASGTFSGGLAIVYDHGHISFIDETGKVVFRTKATQADDFSEGLAAVKIGELWGYVDRAGKMAIPAKFTHVMPFREGIAATNRRFGFTNWKAIDREGRVLFEAPDDGYDHSFGWFSDGLAEHFGGNSFGYIGKNGKWAIKPQFNWAEQFTEGLAAVQVGEKWGYIDTVGRFVIDPVYAAAGPFSEGLAPVRLADQKGDSQVGFIERQGKLLIPPSFDGVKRFCNGIVPVKVGEKWGYADRNGRIVISPRFRGAGNFSGDLAPVMLQQGGGGFYSAYTDRTGKIVWLGRKALQLID